MKKRIKQAAPSTSTSTATAPAVVATPPSVPSPTVNTPTTLSLFTPQKETKLGSLPLYGEQLPPGSYDDIPGAAKHTCSQLKEVMTKVRDLKRGGSAGDNEKVAFVVYGFHI